MLDGPAHLRAGVAWYCPDLHTPSIHTWCCFPCSPVGPFPHFDGSWSRADGHGFPVISCSTAGPRYQELFALLTVRFAHKYLLQLIRPFPPEPLL